MLIALRMHLKAASRTAVTPSQVLAWYDEKVWRDRRTGGLEACETSEEAVALLMRFAYDRDDAHTITRLAGRPARAAILDHGTAWIDGWPPHVDLKRLAMTMLISLASNRGDWPAVRALLAKAKAKDIRLDPYTWSALLRHGLAHVPPQDILKHPDSDPAEEEARPKRLRRLEAALKQATEVVPKPAKPQPSAIKPMVPVVIVPGLLTEGAAKKLALRTRKRRVEHQDKMRSQLLPAILADVSPASASPPAWLITSVLANLADEGKSDVVLRLVRQLVCEFELPDAGADESGAGAGAEAGAVAAPVSSPDTLPSGTSVLNCALRACARNHACTFRETAGVFTDLTGWDITTSSAVEGMATARLVPNETSLAYLLKAVHRPRLALSLLRAFTTRWPDVALGTTPFRMVLEICLETDKKVSARRTLQLFVRKGRLEHARDRVRWRQTLHRLVKRAWISRSLKHHLCDPHTLSSLDRLSFPTDHPESPGSGSGTGTATVTATGDPESQVTLTSVEHRRLRRKERRLSQHSLRAASRPVRTRRTNTRNLLKRRAAWGRSAKRSNTDTQSL